MTDKKDEERRNELGSNSVGAAFICIEERLSDSYCTNRPTVEMTLKQLKDAYCMPWKRSISPRVMSLTGNPRPLPEGVVKPKGDDLESKKEYAKKLAEAVGKPPGKWPPDATFEDVMRLVQAMEEAYPDKTPYEIADWFTRYTQQNDFIRIYEKRNNIIHEPFAEIPPEHDNWGAVYWQGRNLRMGHVFALTRRNFPGYASLMTAADVFTGIFDKTKYEDSDRLGDEFALHVMAILLAHGGNTKLSLAMRDAESVMLLQYPPLLIPDETQTPGSPPTYPEWKSPPYRER